MQQDPMANLLSLQRQREEWSLMLQQQVGGQGVQTGGPWDQREANMHINWLELKAAFIGLQTFAAKRKRACPTAAG